MHAVRIKRGSQAAIGKSILAGEVVFAATDLAESLIRSGLAEAVSPVSIPERFRALLGIDCPVTRPVGDARRVEPTSKRRSLR